MGKQYTFKTTKSTLWLERVLDGMSGRERSEFIRAAIISQLTNSVPTQVDRRVCSSDKRSDEMSDKDSGVQRMDEFGSLKGSDRRSDHEPDFDIIEEDSEDLDDKLNNITFG